MGCNILIADQIEINRKIMVSIVNEMKDVNFFFATDGRQVLECVGKNSVDLIILEIIIPVIDGLEVLKIIKSDEKNNKIPIIICSISDRMADIRLALELGAYDYFKKPFEGRDVRMRIFTKVKNAVYNYRQVQQIHSGETKINEIYTGVELLGAALKERDYITEGHAGRMGKLAEYMAGKLNLREENKKQLVLLTRLHDIGKIGVPDRVLMKPGLLTQEEFKIMKQHTWIGYRIAKSSSDYADIAKLILHHHERWDGNGYPSKLKELEIPIEDRILSVIDAYDAITNNRPYRTKRSHSEALAEIVKYSGKQFDPEIVECFVKHEKGIMLIAKNNGNDKKCKGEKSYEHK
jgi:putative two-component system response regulator